MQESLSASVLCKERELLPGPPPTYVTLGEALKPSEAAQGLLIQICFWVSPRACSSLPQWDYSLPASEEQLTMSGTGVLLANETKKC